MEEGVVYSIERFYINNKWFENCFVQYLGGNLSGSIHQFKLCAGKLKYPDYDNEMRYLWDNDKFTLTKIEYEHLIGHIGLLNKDNYEIW